MRILHTADLHLDRTLFEVRLLDDQAFILDRILDIARDARPDAVVIAGDVFDRANVRGEAVRLLSDWLRRLREAVGHILMIPGNHDAPERIGYAGSLLQAAGVHVCGGLRGGINTVLLDDAHGEVAFHLIPYADPAEAREAFGDPEIQDHDAVMAACLARCLGGDPARRDVVVGHCFVARGSESESERPLAVGGAGSVARHRFDAADLVLLGHLHRPQPLYAGSPLRYSFDEADDRKRVVLAELGPKGQAARRESIPLTPRRDVRVVEAAMDDLLTRPEAVAGPVDDYLLVRLVDSAPVLDAMNRLRRVLPNVLHVERRMTYAPGAVPGGGGPRRAELAPEALFQGFWRHVTGEDALPEGGDREVTAAIEAVRAEAREETGS